MDIDELKTRLYGAAEAVIMSMDHEETGDSSPRSMPNRYRYFTKKHRQRTAPWCTPSRSQLGSTSSLSSFGSSQELVIDSAKLIDLQDDARCHRITSEVIKQRLYESVIHTGPARRRSLTVGIGQESNIDRSSFPIRHVHSMPTTPAYSAVSTPVSTPTTRRRVVFSLLNQRSQGNGRHVCTAEHDVHRKGLACILNTDSSSDSEDDDPVFAVELHIDEDTDFIDRTLPESGAGHDSNPTDGAIYSDDAKHNDIPKTSEIVTKDNSPTKSKKSKVSKNTISSRLLPRIKSRYKGVLTRDMLSPNYHYN